MIVCYLPNEVTVCSAYLLRNHDITTKQMPIILPGGEIISKIGYSSEEVEPGQYNLVIEVNNIEVLTLTLVNGSLGEVFLPTNLVLPVGAKISLKYKKLIGKIANLQIYLKSIGYKVLA